MPKLEEFSDEWWEEQAQKYLPFIPQQIIDFANYQYHGRDFYFHVKRQKWFFEEMVYALNNNVFDYLEFFTSAMKLDFDLCLLFVTIILLSKSNADITNHFNILKKSVDTQAKESKQLFNLIIPRDIPRGIENFLKQQLVDNLEKYLESKPKQLDLSYLKNCLNMAVKVDDASIIYLIFDGYNEEKREKYLNLYQHIKILFKIFTNAQECKEMLKYYDELYKLDVNVTQKSTTSLAALSSENIDSASETETILLNSTLSMERAKSASETETSAVVNASEIKRPNSANNPHRFLNHAHKRTHSVGCVNELQYLAQRRPVRS